jgi:hypothetical protein
MLRHGPWRVDSGKITGAAGGGKARENRPLRRRLAKITVLAVSLTIAIALIAVGGFLWRLSQGPIQINFLKDVVQTEINKNLVDFKVSISGVVIDQDRVTGMPHFRLQNVDLKDAKGTTVARAPRAAVGLDREALFGASIIPRQFELIGPKILVRRRLSGQFELGFSGAPAPESEATDLNAIPDTPGKADRTDSGEIVPGISGSSIIDLLSGTTASQSGGSSGALAGVESIRVSEAEISLYDEANQAFWQAPKADLVFKRMPYGFAVVANATIATDGLPWVTEIAANYRREQKSFAVSARIFDMIPADLSKKIFALSQLAQVRLPLTGHAEMEFTEEGQITKGSAELTAAAGKLSFPDYISTPVAVEEGSIRLDYDPATGGLVMRDSSILIGESRADLAGRLDPVRAEDKKLKAFRIVLNGRNVNIDTTGNADDLLAIDRMDFDGIAAVEEARLDINDLIIRSGQAGLRIRGSFLGGEESAGISLGGSIRSMPAGVLKKLWPPIVAPKTRDWVNKNIKAGRISEGEFIVNLPSNALAKAQKNQRVPNEMIDMKFAMTGVSTSYFKNLPPITNASGKAHLQGDQFDLEIAGGSVGLPSGKTLALEGGRLNFTALLAPITPATFNFDIAGDAQAALEYVDLPDLNLLKNAGLDVNKLGGNAKVSVSLTIPLMKDVPREKVIVTAKAKISDASLKDALEGINLEDGDIALDVGEGKITGAGPIKINDIPAKVTWTRGTGPEADQSATIETELDDKEREKIGVKINDYLRGPVRVKVTVPKFGDTATNLKVEADLSKASMQLSAINWRREAASGTKASFEYLPSDSGGVIEDLSIEGRGLNIKGSIKLSPKKSIASARFPVVSLSEQNRFSLAVTQASDGLALSIDGNSFDARPLIKSMFGSKGGDGTPSTKAAQNLFIEAKVDRVYAHRGEIVTGLSGEIVTKGDSVARANLNGQFISGQPVTLRILPAGDGREIRIAGRDGGAALRAANLYSKIAGGQIDFYALMGNGPGSPVRNGRLVLSNFEVRNEAAIAELDRRGKPKRTGPRNDGVVFRRLTLPFTTDTRFVRLGDSVIKGPELCATADGLIRKADGAMDITGTIVPACGINALPGKIPVLGWLLSGGDGEGLFGLNYALGGSINKPSFQVNPVSAILPGFLRRLSDYEDAGDTPAAPRKRAN